MITSVHNEKIKAYAKLNLKKYRELEKLFIVEGRHLVKEALKNNYIKEIFLLQGEDNDYGDVTYVSKEVLKKLTNLDTPPKVIGICHLLKEGKIDGNVILLDDLKDPGNLGTIIRSAVAFNYQTVILSKESVSIYNPKVIRATEGMLFNLNIITSDLNEVIKGLKKEQYKIYGTDVNLGIAPTEIKKDKHAFIVGSENNGIKKELLNLCDKQIYIKMNPLCESLNAGVSASIIMYELNK